MRICWRLFGGRRRSAEQLGGVLRKIRHNEAGAGAADADERFEDGAIPVQLAFLESRLKHGVLAGDLVGADGRVEALAGGGQSSSSPVKTARRPRRRAARHYRIAAARLR